MNIYIYTPSLAWKKKTLYVFVRKIAEEKFILLVREFETRDSKEREREREKENTRLEKEKEREREFESREKEKVRIRDSRVSERMRERMSE